MSDHPSFSPAELLAFLDLEHIDGDVYRGYPGIWPPDRPAIYGGETAAQALRAAAHTVPDDRRPHSLHGYFLRSGDPKLPVLFHVERDRDGRSFSARRVAARQGGEVIWEMSCSFAAAVDGPEFTPPAVLDVPAPDDSFDPPVKWSPLVEIRQAVPPDQARPAPWADRVWTRAACPLPDDPIIHACLHVFASDVSSGFGDLGVPGVPVMGPSLDHAVWFHHFARADEWTLWNCTPSKVGSHRGLYFGNAYDQDGRLVATMAQEMLLRPPAD